MIDVNRYIVAHVDPAVSGVNDYYVVIDTNTGSVVSEVIARGSQVDMSAIRDALNASAS